MTNQTHRKATARFSSVQVLSSRFGL